MSEQDFEQMLDETFKIIRNGEIVEGTVLDVKDDEIILNIGYKSDGIITKNEYSNDHSIDLKEAVKPGDVMCAKVLKVNDGEGQFLLTYKRLVAEKGMKRLEEAYESGEVLTAPVTQVLEGGICTSVEGTRVFIPASLVSDSYEKDLGKYANQEIEFVITEFNPKRRRIIGNRKQVLLEQKAEKQKELMERIHPGDRVDGVVKNVTDFGAFIDLGGADGLLHISEMSWGRVENPRKLMHVGDQVNVLIKEINGNKIALSLKFEEENPWLTAGEKYAPGNIINGKVARMTDFGAFIELEPGVDALLHVSQISREHVEKPSDVLTAGQIITAKVVDFNGEDRKISLSMKALEPAGGRKKEEQPKETAEPEAAEETAKEAEAEEAAEEIAEEAVAEEVAEEIAEEAVAEEVAEEIVEEALAEELAEEIVEEAAEEVEEEIIEEVAEEMVEEAVEEAAEEIVEETAEEIMEEAAQEIADEMVEEAVEEAAEEIMEETLDEALEESAAEKE